MPKAERELAADRERALALIDVSRETLARLDRFAALLLAWQKTTHLIAPSTVPQLWTRHIADSLQLLALAPQARIWIDLGSGGGFPGLVLACALGTNGGANRPTLAPDSNVPRHGDSPDSVPHSDQPVPRSARPCVHLVESNAKKAAFLREAQRATGAPAVIHAERVESFAARFQGPADVVTARALAPLDRLVGLAFPLLAKTGAQAIFPKGEDAERELHEAGKSWTMDAELIPSRTDPKSRIVVVRALRRREA